MINYSSIGEFKKAFKEKRQAGAIRKDYNSAVSVLGDRQIKFTFSSESVDRDGDIITQSGIDLTYFKTNPVILFAHDHESIPIAKCVAISIENGNLTGVVEFVPADNPAVGAKAEGIFQLCKGGFLSTVSIGFIPKTVEFPDDTDRYAADGVDIKECELCEVSIVAIPSNRDALIQTVSNAEPEVADSTELESPPEPKRYRAARLKRILDTLTK